MTDEQLEIQMENDPRRRRFRQHPMTAAARIRVMQIDTLHWHYARNPTVNNDRPVSLIRGERAPHVKRNQQ